MYVFTQFEIKIGYDKYETLCSWPVLGIRRPLILFFVGIVPYGLKFFTPYSVRRKVTLSPRVGDSNLYQVKTYLKSNPLRTHIL